MGSRNTPRYRFYVFLLLTVAGLAAHGWSLDDGLFFDDHWHRTQYANSDWSFNGLLEAATIDPERFVSHWWQDESIRWIYARPVSVLAAKTIYQASGGSPVALHAFSLMLHILGAFLVYLLCWKLTRRQFWSVAGGLLFIVYSHSIFAVGWLAAQNTVLQTVLCIAALLCYLKATGLNLFPYLNRSANDEVGFAEKVGYSDSGLISNVDVIPPLRVGWFAGSLLLWMLAVLSRENALVLPVIMMAFDGAFGGKAWLKRRWKGYFVYALTGLVFVIWRLVFYYHPLPEFYFRRPEGLGDVSWLIAKLMHYLTAVVWLSPLTVGPTGRYAPFAEATGDCVLMAGILLVLGGGYWLACRRARGFWIWPLWILLAVLPVVPVMATPHSGYMPAVGFAVGMILGPALHDRLKPGKRCVSKYVAIWFLVATTTYMPIYRILWDSVNASEDLTIARIMQQPPPSKATEVFLINVPFVNVYAQLHLKEALQERGIQREWPFHCHVLAYTPSNTLRNEQPVHIRQIDRYSFSLSIEGRPYFSGALGRFLIGAMREQGRFQQGEVIEGEHFDVEIVRADDRGVREMLFRFHEPLGSPQYCFYVTGQDRAAARYCFAEDMGKDRGIDTVEAGQIPVELQDVAARLQQGQSVDWSSLLALTIHADGESARMARQALRPVVLYLSRTLAAPFSCRAETRSEGQWLERGQWWERHVEEESVATLLKTRGSLGDLRERRDMLFTVIDIAKKVICTDLYLTGKQFPGPK
jgi:hypothetical protein